MATLMRLRGLRVQLVKTRKIPTKRDSADRVAPTVLQRDFATRGRVRGS